MTTNEIEQYLGLLMHMGILHMPSGKMYWEDDTRYYQIAEVMSQSRFFEINSNLHVTDNNELINVRPCDHNKIFKVLKMYESIKKNFQEIIASIKKSIYEGTIPCESCQSFIRQFNKDKPSKRGFKVLLRFCADTGLVQDFYMNNGKDLDIPVSEKYLLVLTL